MSFLNRIRFLPITIFVAVLLLTVKIGDIWTGVTEAGIGITGAEAQTEQPPAPADAAAGGQPEQPAIAEPILAPEGAIAPADGDLASTTEGERTEDDSLARLITDDPTLLTPQEIELLQQLAERRREIEARERELEVRVGLLQAAETRIDRKIAELRNLEVEIQSRLRTFDEEQEQKLVSLVRIYENMKPKDAARIFEDLELDTLLDVAERMKERRLAPIMARMNPEKARLMTVELKDLRSLPRGALDAGN